MLPDHEVSRRLKAGRWLAGDVGNNGKPRALSVAKLAERDELVRNRISANRIEEIEQTKTQARPVELRALTSALELPDQWFDEDYDLVGTSFAPPMVTKLLAQLFDRLDAIEDAVNQLGGADAPPAPSDELLQPTSDPETTRQRVRRDASRRAADSR